MEPKYKEGDFVFARAKIIHPDHRDRDWGPSNSDYKLQCVGPTGVPGEQFRIQFVPEEYIVSVKEALQIIKGKMR